MDYDSNASLPSDEDEEVEEGDIDDVFGETADKTRSGSRAKILSDSGGLEQLDPASYTWGILRYAVVKIAMKHIVAFINVAGIELQGNFSIFFWVGGRGLFVLF